MPTLVACLWRRVEATQLGRVPTHFGPATRLGRPEGPRNQGALATSQVEMCPRTANSGQPILNEQYHLILPSQLLCGRGKVTIRDNHSGISFVQTASGI